MTWDSYWKKPVVIQAIRWNGWETSGNLDGIMQYGILRHPSFESFERCSHCGQTMKAHGWVTTPEGFCIVCPGDFVIQGVAGEYYPVKPNIFWAMYEPVEKGADE